MSFVKFWDRRLQVDQCGLGVLSVALDLITFFAREENSTMHLDQAQVEFCYPFAWYVMLIYDICVVGAGRSHGNFQKQHEMFVLRSRIEEYHVLGGAYLPTIESRVV